MNGWAVGGGWQDYGRRVARHQNRSWRNCKGDPEFGASRDNYCRNAILAQRWRVRWRGKPSSAVLCWCMARMSDQSLEIVRALPPAIGDRWRARKGSTTHSGRNAEARSRPVTCDIGACTPRKLHRRSASHPAGRSNLYRTNWCAGTGEGSEERSGAFGCSA